MKLSELKVQSFIVSPDKIKGGTSTGVWSVGCSWLVGGCESSFMDDMFEPTVDIDLKIDLSDKIIV